MIYESPNPANDSPFREINSPFAFNRNCLSCNISNPEDYLVWWDVWSDLANLRNDDGQMCIPCLEYRIERNLRVEDSCPLPCTVKGRDRAVVDKLGLPLLKLYEDGTTNADTPVWVLGGVDTLYRKELFDWYFTIFDLDSWLGGKHTIYEVGPGEEDSSKKVIMTSIDFPASALPNDDRGIYRAFKDW